ncbi:acetoacetate decarboxylase family protein [Allokutzneria sp. NRRL B-24872]|uniref:acetoacetate decarboxylase family protein n=1 Tax=Allokutzneria sp. NRRL B-24872 TaxID=1137961 RepID=UPI000A370063|nr:acetoacetate decarboxylase family protein [Allokutzneria sp. NRRL B-24872]
MDLPTPPIYVRDACATLSVFLADHAASAELLHYSGMRPVKIGRNKTACVIAHWKYKDADLGAYDEAMVLFPVGGDGKARLLNTLLRFKFRMFAHWVPVNSEFSRVVGRALGGFPKDLCDFQVSEGASGVRYEVVDGGTPVWTVHSTTRRTVRIPGTLPGGSRPAIYTWLDGVRRRAPITMRGSRVRLGRGGSSLELGDHPRADELRAIGISAKPVATIHVGKVWARVDAAEVLTE